MVFCSILYYVSQKVHDANEEIQVVVAEVEQEKESIRVLKAEWSYLNRPQRLEKLAAKYLALKKAVPSQFIELGDVKLAANVITENPIIIEEDNLVVNAKRKFKQIIVDTLQEQPEPAVETIDSNIIAEEKNDKENTFVAKNGEGGFKAMIRAWGND